MKIFVCEFITGGGLYREPLSTSLAHEGAMMRSALLSDLAELDGIEVITTCDARLPAPANVNQVVRISQEDDVWQSWGDGIAQADALWPIAPESSGALLRLSELAISHNKVLLGSTPQAVKVASSKLATLRLLESAGLSVVPTFTLAEWQPNQSDTWVAKPDDGVGCLDTGYFETTSSLMDWMQQGRQATHVIQPYIKGEPASLSMLCEQGQAWLMSCNRQRISLRSVSQESGKFSYAGSVVNGMAQYWHRFDEIAQAVAAAMPGLAGYVGVDVLVNDQDIYVLEVNPRLTTSYVGLHQAMAHNPAKLVLDLLYNHHFKWPRTISRNLVEVILDA